MSRCHLEETHIRMPTDRSDKTLQSLFFWNQDHRTPAHQWQKETGDGQVKTQRRMNNGATSALGQAQGTVPAVMLTTKANIVCKSLMRNHYPLWSPSRTRGVDEAGQVFHLY